MPTLNTPTSHANALDQLIREWNQYAREDRSLLRPTAREREDERFRQQFHLFGINVPRELLPQPSTYGPPIAEAGLPSVDTFASWAREYVSSPTNIPVSLEPGAVNYHASTSIIDDPFNPENITTAATSPWDDEDDDLIAPANRSVSLVDIMREQEASRLRRGPRPLPRSRSNPPAEVPAWRKYPKLLSTGRPQSGKTTKLFREMLAIPDYDIVFISNHRESSLDMWKDFLKDNGIAFSFSTSMNFVIRKDTEKKIHFRHLDTEIKSFLRGMGPNTPIFIDNLDHCLSNLVGNHGTLVSLTWNIE